MARMPLSNIRTSGTYALCFGKETGDLLTKCQSTAIKSGNELEKIVVRKCLESKVAPFFFGTTYKELTEKHGLWVMPLDDADRLGIYLPDKGKPDFLIFEKTPVEGSYRCMPVEIKIGGELDTKKSDGEVETLRRCKKYLTAHHKDLVVEPIFCAFSAETDSEARNNFKADAADLKIWIGSYLCSYLNIDYEDICIELTKDVNKNKNKFAEMIALIFAHDDAMLKAYKNKVESIERARNRRKPK